MKSNIVFIILIFISFAFSFNGCIDDPHDRYNDPPWLGGTNIQTLEKDGNYKQFLALMDKAEYRVSIENQLFTLFAPNDSSFEAYFNKRGISSVDDLTRDQAVELFGQMILINPRSREQLIYEYAWSELQDTGTEYASLFHRKETYSVPVDYYEHVKYNVTYLGQDLRIHRDNTFVPLFTTEYMEDYFGDPNGSDYLVMYPGSVWSGTQWNDANVTSIGRTSSGFIYYLDRVVEPMPTIDKYLMDHPDDFSLFYDIAQRFATYSQSGQTEDKTEWRYSKGYSIDNFNIANEKGPDTGDPGDMIYLYTAFVPPNDVLQDYLNKTVYAHGYTSLDDVPKFYLVYLLQSQIIGFLELPSKIDKRFVNYYGDEIKVDSKTDIRTSKMCSNGVIYVMNRILEPNVFTCVPGPLYYDKNYSTLLYSLNKTGDLNTLSNEDNKVTLFASSDDKLEEYGIRTSEDDYNNVTTEIRKSNGSWTTMNILDLQTYLRNYYVYGVYEDFNGEGYVRMTSNNYIYYNSGKIYGGGNQFDGDYCTITQKIASEKNGNLFYLDNAIKKPKTAAEIILSDPDLSSFGNLLAEAGLIDSVVNVNDIDVKYPRIIFMPTSKQWTVLAPNNQAIADAENAGLIPSDINELKNFLYYHFVKNTSVFDDGQFSGTVSTQRIDTIIGSDIQYNTLDIVNALHNLSVTDNAGNVVTINHNDADRLIETGVLHKISSVLVIP